MDIRASSRMRSLGRCGITASVILLSASCHAGSGRESGAIAAEVNPDPQEIQQSVASRYPGLKVWKYKAVLYERRRNGEVWLVNAFAAPALDASQLCVAKVADLRISFPASRRSRPIVEDALSRQAASREPASLACGERSVDSFFFIPETSEISLSSLAELLIKIDAGIAQCEVTSRDCAGWRRYSAFAGVENVREKSRLGEISFARPDLVSLSYSVAGVGNVVSMSASVRLVNGAPSELDVSFSDLPGASR